MITNLHNLTFKHANYSRISNIPKTTIVETEEQHSFDLWVEIAGKRVP